MNVRTQRSEIVDLAHRIVRRHQSGNLDTAAELIMRALAASDADTTFALALALAEQALTAVEDSRLDAATNGTPWQPAVQLPNGVLITPADTTTAPVPLAMRLIAALHNGMSGDKAALGELGDIYEQASRADHPVFHGMFAALATYAAHGLGDRIEVLTEPATSTAST